VPSFAEMDGGARNNAIDKLASRALWWFRWAAAATLLFGLFLLFHQQGQEITDSDYIKTGQGISIATGVILGITMFANVWLVIWPKQKIVIANARNVQAGGEPDPNAAAAGRAATLASRQNTIFSLPMLLFMVGTAHFFGGYDTTSDRAIYWIVTVIIWIALELNCLGVIGGKAAGHVTNWIYEDHKRAIGAGLALVVIWYALFEICFG